MAQASALPTASFRSSNTVLVSCPPAPSVVATRGYEVGLANRLRVPWPRSCTAPAAAHISSWPAVVPPVPGPPTRPWPNPPPPTRSTPTSMAGAVVRLLNEGADTPCLPSSSAPRGSSRERLTGDLREWWSKRVRSRRWRSRVMKSCSCVHFSMPGG